MDVRATSRSGALTASRVWRLLWIWTALSALMHYAGAGGSWHYFATGAAFLFGDDPSQGLHLYAAHPELQIGPLSFAVARPLQLLGLPAGRLAAVVLMSLTGPPLLASIWALVPAPHRRPDRLLIAGLVFLPIWAELATHAGHLDDVLALALTLAAMHARVHERPVLTGVLLAAAVDAKPWALAFVPLLLMRPARSALIATAACAAGIAAAWLPFALFDPQTVQAAHFTIPNAAGSALRVLGYHGARTPPWDRPAQLVLACVLGTLAMFRGRWAAVILLGTAARILLDPETFVYYTSGVLLGTVAFDLIVTRRRVPVLTLTAAASLYVSKVLTKIHVLPLTNAQLGELRAGFVVVAIAVVLAGSRTAARPARGAAPPAVPPAPGHVPAGAGRPGGTALLERPGGHDHAGPAERPGMGSAAQA